MSFHHIPDQRLSLGSILTRSDFVKTDESYFFDNFSSLLKAHFGLKFRPVIGVVSNLTPFEPPLFLIVVINSELTIPSSLFIFSNDCSHFLVQLKGIKPRVYLIFISYKLWILKMMKL